MAGGDADGVSVCGLVLKVSVFTSCNTAYGFEKQMTSYRSAGVFFVLHYVSIAVYLLIS